MGVITICPAGRNWCFLVIHPKFPVALVSNDALQVAIFGLDVRPVQGWLPTGCRVVKLGKGRDGHPQGVECLGLPSSRNAIQIQSHF
jgi:hypothetical protein